jgi:Flp pilus assembly pilin Flp
MLDHFVHASRGQGLVEYALLILFLVILIVGALALIAPELGAIFTNASNAL